MDKLTSVFHDRDELIDSLSEDEKAGTIEIDPFCPECESRNITYFARTPTRYKIDKFIKSGVNLFVLVGNEELDYDEEFDMFRCQDCDAEWKDHYLKATTFTATSTDGVFVDGCDMFEQDFEIALHEKRTK